MNRVLALSGILILALGAPALAQFVQYTAPGALADVPEDAEERARQQAEDAPWRVGAIRMAPHFNIDNVGYDENVFSSSGTTTRIDDSHATLGAGLAGYLRVGSRSLVSAFVAPEYFWWQDTEELRQLNVNTGAAWFGSFDRITLTARAFSIERETPLSDEIEAPVQISEDGFDIETTVEITRRLGFFGVASDSKLEHGTDTDQFVDGLAVRSLDRDNRRRVLGLELRGSHLGLRLGYEATDVDFVEADSRNNTGDGPAAQLSYQRRRLDVDLTYSDLEIDFVSPELGERSQSFGTARVALEFRGDTTASVFAAEGLAFAVNSSTGIIESERRGLSLTRGFSSRFDAGLFAEVGTETFVDSQQPGRVDDLEAIGLRIRFELRDDLAITGDFTERTWDSNLDEFDRSTTGIGIGIELGGELLPW